MNNEEILTTLEHAIEHLQQEDFQKGYPDYPVIRVLTAAHKAIGPSGEITPWDAAPAPQFPIGARVAVPEFFDTSGGHHRRINGLTVVEAERVKNLDTPSWWRVRAEDDAGFYFRASERFFVAA